MLVAFFCKELIEIETETHKISKTIANTMNRKKLRRYCARQA